jgi:hypothetical protein
MIKLTSLFSWRKEKQAAKSQSNDVARFIIAETKAGRPCWIRNIAVHANKIGHDGLSQISTASARVNYLRKHGAYIAGQQYVIHELEPRKCPYSNRLVEHFCMVLESEHKRIQQAKVDRAITGD